MIGFNELYITSSICHNCNIVGALQKGDSIMNAINEINGSRKIPPGKLLPIKLPHGKLPLENSLPENSRLEYSHPFH